jgi:hypothetical protein
MIRPFFKTTEIGLQRDLLDLRSRGAPWYYAFKIAAPPLPAIVRAPSLREIAGPSFAQVPPARDEVFGVIAGSLNGRGMPQNRPSLGVHLYPEPEQLLWFMAQLKQQKSPLRDGPLYYSVQLSSVCIQSLLEYMTQQDLISEPDLDPEWVKGTHIPRMLDDFQFLRELCGLAPAYTFER